MEEAIGTALERDLVIAITTDYPHEQAADIRHALWSFQAHTDVSQRAKEKILRDNIKALYGM